MHPLGLLIMRTKAVFVFFGVSAGKIIRLVINAKGFKSGENL